MIAKSILIPILTIWIHGTTRITKVIPYAKEYLGNPAGMRKTSDIHPDTIHGKIAATLCAAAPEYFSMENFYCFGWSGKLDPEERERVGIQAARSIASLVDQYEKKHGQKPLVRVITHSHGGNVALNMVKAHEQLPELVIDELIVLACPVQKRTLGHAQHPMFKRIYSIYSHWDMLQVLDPQGLPDLQESLKQLFTANSPAQAQKITQELLKQQVFSERKFTKQDNLTHIKVIKGHRGLFHVEFILSGFMENLVTIIEEAEKLKTSDPVADEFLVDIQ